MAPVTFCWVCSISATLSLPLSSAANSGFRRGSPAEAVTRAARSVAVEASADAVPPPERLQPVSEREAATEATMTACKMRLAIT